MESPDFTDPVHGVPVFSLYGEARRPSGQSMGTFDVVLIDMQDVGCRIYTFITTLLYMIEACAKAGKEVWVLDRPNPAGRPIEGLTLQAGWESFVGAGPMPMRHGLTLGELGAWFVAHFKIDVDYRVIAMEGYDPEARPALAGRWASASGSIRARMRPICSWRVRMPHGDAGRHDVIGGTRNDAPAGIVRCARH